MSLAAGARWSKVGVVDVEGVVRARLEFMIVVHAMYELATSSHDIMTEKGFCSSISATGRHGCRYCRGTGPSRRLHCFESLISLWGMMG